jgi:hypothetical protein
MHEHTFDDELKGETMANINRVVISGNLTKDPELRQLPAATRCASCAWR